jgi:NADH dehydrogenase (ubiquinone) Fe-S protein 6
MTKIQPSRGLNAVRLGMCRFASATTDSSSSSSSKSLTTAPKPGEVAQTKTHTGVVWDKDDYRLARFVEAKREVNPNFAIDLVNKVPPTKVKARSVWCDGGDDKLGHPKVYINLDKPGPQACGYCGLRYVKDEDHHH